MIVTRGTAALWLVASVEFFHSPASQVEALVNIVTRIEGQINRPAKVIGQCEQRNGQQLPFKTGGTCHLLSPLTSKFPHNRPHASACLPRAVRDLGHDRVVANRKSDEASPRRRVSAWLPPGLALGWLALLAVFVHGAGSLLAVWAATTALAVLSVQRRITDSPDGSEHSEEGSARTSGATAIRTAQAVQSTTTTSDKDESAHSAEPEKAAAPISHASSPSSAARPMAHDSSPRPETAATASGPADHFGEVATADLGVTLGLRVLTAAEVASLLRVEASVVVAAISDGELPGNRIGIHWRVDHGALVRWLQGGYPAVQRANPDSTQP